VNSTASPSEASGPAAGYYYQVRYALLRALKSIKKYPTASVSIEKLEDVAIEYDAAKADLEQLKHSLNTGKTYSDADPAVWRTLGNWSRLYRKKTVPAGVRLFLTTNGNVASGAAIGLLSADRSADDLQQAIDRLVDVATTSSNSTTSADRDSFLELDAPLRQAMLASVPQRAASRTSDSVGSNQKQSGSDKCCSGTARNDQASARTTRHAVAHTGADIVISRKQKGG
jgi:hypothetical protein